MVVLLGRLVKRCDGNLKDLKCFFSFILSISLKGEKEEKRGRRRRGEGGKKKKSKKVPECGIKSMDANSVPIPTF